jgi:ubiquitin-protein ligase
MTSPRLRRLKLDAEKLDARFGHWPLIHISPRAGMPPEAYQVTYNVKGLYAAPDGSILERDKHVMEVNLSLAYPRRAPQCKMLTPVFHPNFDDASVCIGDFWAASEGLDDLIIRIGRMICYQEYNTKSPLNGLAAKWADEHVKMLPVHAGDVAPPHKEKIAEPEKLVVQVHDEAITSAKPAPVEKPGAASAVASAVAYLFAAPTIKRLPVLVDCLSGEDSIVDQFPYRVGADEASNWRIVEDGLPGSLFSLQTRGGVCYLEPAPGAAVYYDGQPLVTDIEISTGADHAIATCNQFFLLRMTSEPAKWVNHINPHQWHIHRFDDGTSFGPYGWPELPARLGHIGGALDQYMVHCKGMIVGFFASQLIPEVPNPEDFASTSTTSLWEPPPQTLLLPPQPIDQPEIDAEHGEFTCPVCWLKFDRGDVMDIAVHASLRGDPLLGLDVMQRFLATHHNDKGQALDAKGVPTTDQACPHCRRKLPPGFLDTPHHIFSIVGAPSAGKSYYLSVLIRQLQQELFKNFKIAFRDADPSENAILTAMKTSLFSAGTPQEAALAKTALEGALYETLPRYGRKVRLPKPFIFRLSSAVNPGQASSVVFYDNAGEHFEPTRNSADSPGAQHIAVASGIFFLFDPLHCTGFRARLLGVKDPQMSIQRQDQQDVILAEMEARIKSLLRMDYRQSVQTPLAFMIGKCDTWISLLGAEPLLPAIIGGRLSLANIQANSSRLRDFLMEIDPGLVANAESISSNVMYFAISPLGASPVEFVDEHDGSRKIGPDPLKLNPQFVEIPTLWVLSRLMSDLIPSTSS